MSGNMNPVSIQLGACDSARRAVGRMKGLAMIAWILLALAAHGIADKTPNILTGFKMPSGPTPAPSPAPVPVPPPPEPWAEVQQVSTAARGLRSPDGIARDPETGDLYVSEEDAATIVRIRPNGARQILFDRATPIYEENGGARKKVAGLRSPEGLALDGKGRLYVVEDIPGGRLISYNISEPAVSSYPCGRVESLPTETRRFAWESVDARPSGELLVAGSSMEAFLGAPTKEGVFGLFRGAILYRDAQGEWWMPLNPPLTSYSAVGFSADGNYAFFACEIPGDVGCLDLRSHRLRTYHASQTLRSPEGLCALPDGSALVAEEAGRIYRLDPIHDTLQLLFDNQHTIESLAWDAAHDRLLVTDDQRGTLVSLQLRVAAHSATPEKTQRDILFQAQFRSLEMIPDKCPDYLTRVLKLGGYDPFEEGGEMAFRDFARQYCLVAIDAETRLLSTADPLEDPIQRVQFVIVAPYLIGAQDGKLVWSSSGFAAVKASGQVVKTRLVTRQAIHGDLMESRFMPLGGQQIALPMPFSTRIDSDGIASIHFMGMTETPDYLIMLNTAAPDQSFMLVMEPNERPQLYAVYLPPQQDSNYWVIGLERKEPEVWRRLSFNP